MSDRFAGIPRGKPLPGARKIAGYMLDDEEQWRSIYSLPREEFGLIDLNGKLTGFTVAKDKEFKRADLKYFPFAQKSTLGPRRRRDGRRHQHDCFRRAERRRQAR